MVAGLFGMEYQGDPTGALLGQNYDPAIEQQQKLWGLLEGAGQALLHPTRGSGDLGAIANAFSGGAKSMNEAGTSYLATAYKRQLAQDELRRKQYEEDQQRAQDKAWIDFAAGLPPDQRKMVQDNPALAAAVGKQWAQSLYPNGVKWGRNPIQMKDTEGNYFYRLFSDEGGTQIIPEVPGTVPKGQLKLVETINGIQPIDPNNAALQGGPIPGSSPGAIKQAEAQGAAVGKGAGEMQLDGAAFMANLPDKVARIDDAMANSKKYAGIAPEKFINMLKNPTEYYAWTKGIESIKADVTAATMANTKSLYPMSEADREFLIGMSTGGVDKWYNPDDFNKAMGIIKNAYRRRAERIQKGEEATVPNTDINAIFGEGDDPLNLFGTGQ